MMLRNDPRSQETPPRGDRGIAVVFFAISVTAMLAVGALVLGGSIGYSASRSAQTAADSAALAGTTAVREHKQNWLDMPADAILIAAQDAASDNGATLTKEDCELVAAGYARTHSEADVIGPCDEIKLLEEADFRAVAGVRVRVSETRSVPFAAFVDQDSITGQAVASATAQPPVSGRSPFMVCTSPDAVGHPAQALIPDASSATGYAVNDAAVGKHFVLHGNQIKYEGRDCGNPASDWRGLVQFGSTFPVPSPDPNDPSGWWQTESGNKNGNMPRTLAGSNACSFGDGGSVDNLEIGCRIAVPLCPKGNGSTSDFRLYCVTMGAFEITHKSKVAIPEDLPEDTPCDSVKNNIICGKFLGAATILGGQGRADTPDANEAAIIKLVE